MTDSPDRPAKTPHLHVVSSHVNEEHGGDVVHDDDDAEGCIILCW
jgi:hypothetical protein